MRLRLIYMYFLTIVSLSACTINDFRNFRISVQKVDANNPSNRAPVQTYPPEKNFVKDMGIGDTVFIFIKISGEWNPYRFSRYTIFKTLYSKQEVYRLDSELYAVKEYYGRYEGFEGLVCEFDTMRNRLQDARKLFNVLEIYCPHYEQSYGTDTIDYGYVYGPADSCIRYVSNKGESLEYFQAGELTSPKYQKWRFQLPSYEQLDKWRRSLPPYDKGISYPTEALLFKGDTCKITYGEYLASFWFAADWMGYH